jgi:hypothetical protein
MKQNRPYKFLPGSRRYSSFYQERDSFYRSFINQYYVEMAHRQLSEEFHSHSYLTNTIISPQDIPFGASPRRVIWKAGMPSFQVKDVNDFKNHKILFYRTRLVHEKVLIQFHFINNFFYYSQLSFLCYNEKTDNILADSIRSKYQCSANFGKDETVLLTDICGNKMIVEKGIYLTVSYISGDNYPKAQLEEQIRLKNELSLKADNQDLVRLIKIV